MSSGGRKQKQSTHVHTDGGVQGFELETCQVDLVIERMQMLRKTGEVRNETTEIVGRAR